MVQEGDEGLVKDRALVEGTRVAMMVGGAREARIGELARWWWSKAHPGR